MHSQPYFDGRLDHLYLYHYKSTGETSKCLSTKPGVKGHAAKAVEALGFRDRINPSFFFDVRYIMMN